MGIFERHVGITLAKFYRAGGENVFIAGRNGLMRVVYGRTGGAGFFYCATRSCFCAERYWLRLLIAIPMTIWQMTGSKKYPILHMDRHVHLF